MQGRGQEFVLGVYIPASTDLSNLVIKLTILIVKTFTCTIQ